MSMKLMSTDEVRENVEKSNIDLATAKYRLKSRMKEYRGLTERFLYGKNQEKIVDDLVIGLGLVNVVNDIAILREIIRRLEIEESLEEL